MNTAQIWWQKYSSEMCDFLAKILLYFNIPQLIKNIDIVTKDARKIISHFQSQKGF